MLGKPYLGLYQEAIIAESVFTIIRNPVRVHPRSTVRSHSAIALTLDRISSFDLSWKNTTRRCH